MAVPDKLSPLLYTTVSQNDVTRYGGYHRELFMRAFTIIEEALVICTLCQGVKRDACTFQGMTTCKPCSYGPDKATPVRDIRELVARLVMKCPLSSRGCSWTGTVTEGEIHLQRCKELLYKCPNKCELGISRRSMEQHGKVCVMRQVSCEICGVELQAIDLEKHLFTCSPHTVSCTNCEVVMKRDELEDHMNKCSNKCESSRITNAITQIEEIVVTRQQDTLPDRNMNEHYLNIERETAELKRRVSSLEKKNELLTKALFTKPELMKYDSITGRILEGYSWSILDVNTLTRSVSTIESPPFYIWHNNVRITANSGLLGSISLTVSRLPGYFDEIIGDNCLSSYRCELVPVDEGEPLVLTDRITHKLDLNTRSYNFLFLDISLLKDELYCKDNCAVLHIYFDLTH
ncbi:hypothetical protein LOD99_13948 [Oopsacas minuta]|uniref:TRAF-type domain-containing protein n=1 Tax=Oopsacas minuta TaxID=111878 RepID=A0AAV7KG89_9METZ|nr:hypothetical protein LOD99_13948 [Oopsacas minuta]